MSYQPQSWPQNLTLFSQEASPALIVASGSKVAGNIPINGSGITLSGATLPSPALVGITSAGNDSGVTFNLLGFDAFGNYIADAIIGANASIAYSNFEFSVVTSIIPTINTTSTITVGTTGTPTGISLSQSGTANTPLLLNGAWKSGNYVTAIPGFITITSTGNDSSTIFKITGKDSANRVYTVSVTGPNVATITIPVPYYEILQGSINISQNSVGNISIGVSSLTSTVWVPFDQNRTQFNDSIIVSVSPGGDLNYTVEYTQDDVLSGKPAINIQPDVTLVDQTASGNTPNPFTTWYARVRYNSWTSGYTTNQFVVSGSYASRKNF